MGRNKKRGPRDWRVVQIEEYPGSEGEIGGPSNGFGNSQGLTSKVVDQIPQTVPINGDGFTLQNNNVRIFIHPDIQSLNIFFRGSGYAPDKSVDYKVSGADITISTWEYNIRYKGYLEEHVILDRKKIESFGNFCHWVCGSFLELPSYYNFPDIEVRSAEGIDMIFRYSIIQGDLNRSVSVNGEDIVSGAVDNAIENSLKLLLPLLLGGAGLLLEQ